MSLFDDVQRQSLQAEQDGKKPFKLSTALFGDDGSKRRQALSGVKNGITGSFSKIKETVNVGKTDGVDPEEGGEENVPAVPSSPGKHSTLGTVFLGGEGSKRRQAVAATTGTVTKAADTVKDAVVSLPENVKGAVAGGVEGIKKGSEDGVKKVAELHRKASEKVMLAGGKVAGKIKNVLPAKQEEKEDKVEEGDVVGAVGAAVKKTLRKAGGAPIEVLRVQLQTAEQNVYQHNRKNQETLARHQAPPPKEGDGAVELEMHGGRQETPHERVRRLVEERRQRMAKGETQGDPIGASGMMLSLDVEDSDEEEELPEVLDMSKLAEAKQL